MHKLHSEIKYSKSCDVKSSYEICKLLLKVYVQLPSGVNLGENSPNLVALFSIVSNVAQDSPT
jgi:hypothetical protein